MQHTGGRVWETVRYYKSGCRRLQRTPLVETAQYFATLLDGLIQFTQANQAGKVLADMWQQTIAECRLVCVEKFGSNEQVMELIERGKLEQGLRSGRIQAAERSLEARRLGEAERRKTCMNFFMFVAAVVIASVFVEFFVCVVLVL